MGRHSAERDTGENRLDPAAALSEPRDGYTDTPETPDDDLSGFLPDSMFDPDDCAAWNFEPFLRAIDTVELPEDPQ